MGTSNKYSSDLWIVSKQVPSWIREREGAGHVSFNTKTEYILALPLNLQAGMKILGVEMH